MFETCAKTLSAPLNGTESDSMLDYKLFASGAIQLDQVNNNGIPQQSDW